MMNIFYFILVLKKRKKKRMKSLTSDCNLTIEHIWNGFYKFFIGICLTEVIVLLFLVTSLQNI